MKTDLHTHIIPDVDDGSPDLTTSLCVLREAYQQGINTFFATSHSFAYIDPEEARKSYQAFLLLKEAVHSDGLPIHIYLGCELLCMKTWMERIIQGLNEGQYPSMNDTRYVLIEFTTFDITMEEVEFCLNSLLDAGWFPILAHIERYVNSFASLDFIRRIKEKGCLVQVSFNALYEEKIQEIKSFARDILHYEMADFLGSDSHSMNHRPPEIRQGLDYIMNHCSKGYVQQLLEGNVSQYLI